MSDGTSLGVPAGWYPDRNEANLVRWWDGQQWTDQTHSTAPAAAAFEQPVSVAALGAATSATVSAITAPAATAPAATVPTASAPTAAAPSAPAIAPGWYPDNFDRSIQRWWDGVQWTTHTAPAGPVVSQGAVGSIAFERVASANNTMATLSLIISIVSFAGLIFAPLLVLSLAGIIMGGVALRRARRFAPHARRRGQALAGIIVGAVSLVVTVLLTISAIIVYQQVHGAGGSLAQQSSQQSGGGDSAGSDQGEPSTLADIKNEIARSIQLDESAAVTSVTCDPAASMVSGSVYNCAAVVSDGRWTLVRVNIGYPSVGSGMSYGISYGPLNERGTTAPANAYSLDLVEQELAMDLSRAWQLDASAQSLATVLCDSGASTSNGSKFRCGITLPDGRTGAVLVTMIQPGGFDVNVVQLPAGIRGSTDSGSSGSTGTDSDPDVSHS